MRELVLRFENYRLDTAGLRGVRQRAAVVARREATEEFAAWALWQVQKHPELSALWMRVIEKELGDYDEDSVAPAA